MFDETGGGGAVVQTDIADLQSAAGKCNSTAVEFSNRVNGLMGQLEGMREALVGRTGNAFQTLKEDVAAQMLLLNDALEQIGEDVGYAGVAYEQGDEEGQATLHQVDTNPSGIESMLGGGGAR